ncbi:MAG: hypothetical protein AAFQ92_30180, partial [Bacteroidota bacterium]
PQKTTLSSVAGKASDGGAYQFIHSLLPDCFGFRLLSFVLPQVETKTNPSFERTYSKVEVILCPISFAFSRTLQQLGHLPKVFLKRTYSKVDVILCPISFAFSRTLQQIGHLAIGLP